MESLRWQVIEEFARVQEVYYADRYIAAVEYTLEKRREAVRDYRARLSSDEKQKQNHARWARRSAEPGFKERERARVLAWKAKKREEEMRNRAQLPDERNGFTHKFEILASRPGSDPNAPLETYTVDGYLTTGEYKGGRLGEVFIKMGKHGGEQAVYDAWALASSVALQHGASVDGLFRKWVGSSFEPSGPTTNKDVPRCTSVLDLCSRIILARYGKKTEDKGAGDE